MRRVVTAGRLRRRLAVAFALVAALSTGALAELRALPPPKAARHRFIEFYSLLEQQTSVLRQAAVAAWNHDATLSEELGRRRVKLTHQKDVSEPSLQGCPVSLPA